MAGQGHRDAGETLIELVISIALLGIGATLVIGTLFTGIKATSLTTGTATNQNALLDWAEQIEAMPYAPCAQTSGYVNLVLLPAGTTLSITEIGIWDGAAYQVSTPACVPANDQGLQEITLRAESLVANPTPAQAELVIIKRRGCESGC
ncbi:MAG: prepilin-type N-terminal cleavage/methylation domain-containing protein [Actinobacteria bacterium]|nr:prepilin-type N-terminal cleavage/methylation domain-containing protein [Actinomycetota bacterium]